MLVTKPPIGHDGDLGERPAGASRWAEALVSTTPQRTLEVGHQLSWLAPSAGMGGQLRGCEMATSPSKAWHPHFYPTRADTVRYRSGNMGVHIHEAKRTTFIGLAPGKTATVTLVASGAALDPAAELAA